MNGWWLVATLAAFAALAAMVLCPGFGRNDEPEDYDFDAEFYDAEEWR